MLYKAFLTEEAKKQLRDFPEEMRRLIGYKIHLMQDDLAGDIKKLKAREKLYRLKVGSYRIFFTLEKDQIHVYKIGKKRMIKPANIPMMEFEKLRKEVFALRNRVEDLEDLLELEQAIKRNGKKSLIPLDQVLSELDIPIPSKKKK